MPKVEQEQLSQADILLQIAQTLAQVQANASGGAGISETLDRITETLAGVAQRTMPENPQHPGISAFSHPEGDLKHPKDPLKCEMFWVGYPETLETLTPDEVYWLNKLEPGAYRVTKGNGNQIPFTVEPKYNMNGKLESLSVSFPCKGDQSTDHRSKIDYIREAMGEHVPSLNDLLAEVARLKKELAAGVAA